MTEPEALEASFEKTQGQSKELESGGFPWPGGLVGGWVGDGEEVGEKQRQRASAPSWSSTPFVRAFLGTGETQSAQCWTFNAQSNQLSTKQWRALTSSHSYEPRWDREC